MVLPSKRRHFESSPKREKKKLDFVTGLFSKELTLKVFSFLSLKDLVQCSAVSMHWSSIVNDETLWKPLFMNRFRQSSLSNQFIYNQRQLVKKYDGSWKLKYKIHHNWQIGNCRILEIDNIFDNTKCDIKYHLQFQHNTLFIANTHNSVIEIWSFEALTCTKKKQLQATELVSNPKTYITFFKIKNRYLIAGYSNGGFTLWKIDDHPEELLSYFPGDVDVDDPVVTISMDEPILTLNTSSHKMYIFRVHPSSAAVNLIHYLESPYCWSPIAVDIKKHHGNQWRVLICCGFSGEDHSIWIMEIILSSYAVVSTRQGYNILSHSDIIPPSSSKITSMAFSPPYLITSHPNNTLKHYKVIDDRSRADGPSSGLSLTFTQTLYGHAFKVDALSVDDRKLLSADRAGIKIWDNGKSGECQVSLRNYTDQSSMDELPDATIEALDFDEDKIGALVYNRATGYLLRLWLFNI